MAYSEVNRKKKKSHGHARGRPPFVKRKRQCGRPRVHQPVGIAGTLGATLGQSHGPGIGRVRGQEAVPLVDEAPDQPAGTRFVVQARLGFGGSPGASGAAIGRRRVGARACRGLCAGTARFGAGAEAAPHTPAPINCNFRRHRCVRQHTPRSATLLRAVACTRVPVAVTHRRYHAFGQRRPAEALSLVL